MNDEIVIIAARRTPIGAFQGVFSPCKATELGGAAAAAALADARVRGRNRRGNPRIA
jgi:acetyl-CoA C-acetyltransferase